MEEKKVECSCCSFRFYAFDEKGLCEYCIKLNKSFDVTDDTCYACGRKIEEYDWDYYARWGRKCKNCNYKK